MRITHNCQENKTKSMKIISSVLLFTILLAGCASRNSYSVIINDTPTDTIATCSMNGCKGRHVSLFKGDTISFFGELLALDDSTHVMQQIAEIAAKDKMLSVDGRVLTVGEVVFGINVRENGVILISSVPIDDPLIKPVVQYLKSLYGNPTDADPEVGYYWFDKDIRVRRLHSEEGGTTIIFNGVIKNDEETPAG